MLITSYNALFFLPVVAYLFRMTGQVLGVSVTSGVLLQSILVKELHKRITGPGSAELIDKIRFALLHLRPPNCPLQAAS